MKRASANTSVLYITYDGLLEPLGQSQVLPYLRGLAGDYDITVMSFEKPQDMKNGAKDRLADNLQEYGIEWIPLRYHKRPSLLATAYDAAHGGLVACFDRRARRASMVHARSYVPALLALFLKKARKRSFIFDMRGFWPEEKVDGGAWSAQGGLYRLAKLCEKKFISGADAIVTLTSVAEKIIGRMLCIQDGKSIVRVIPTCVDLSLFRPLANQPRMGEKFVLGYVGSVGSYYRFPAVVEFFKVLKSFVPDAKLLVINRGSHPYIQRVFAECGISKDEAEVLACSHAEVPAQIARMNAGICFTDRRLSHAGTAPTRVGEMLACGVPCVVNSGMGDTDEILAEYQAGVVLKSCDQQKYQVTVPQILSLCRDPGTPARCVKSAHRYFSLEQGVDAYHSIYRELTEKSD